MPFDRVSFYNSMQEDISMLQGPGYKFSYEVAVKLATNCSLIIFINRLGDEIQDLNDSLLKRPTNERVS